MINWHMTTGAVPTDVHYEATPERGVRMRIDPICVDDWPAFRWSVDISFAGQRRHHDEVAVDLSAACVSAENFTAHELNKLRQN
jgi:hypothetical protein